tara:strand:+ start:191 stop:445 length:255 start_codon:yes stop_codon:yes gene_type:complete
MKWYLVNRFDEIVDTCEIASGVGISGAKTYFKGIKKMTEDREFDNLWRVMSKEKYDMEFKANLQNRQIEWWKEDKDIADDELKL